MQETKNCCKTGILYGVFPHIFCIAFIIFSVIGATTATVIFKNFLLIPYFFHLLVAISFFFATISALIYLKRNNSLHVNGIKNNWKYLGTLYSITILTNLLLFFIIFPVMANYNAQNISKIDQLSALSIKVQIPCSGHAPLIIDELKKNGGIGSIKFEMPNNFEIKYNPKKTSPEKIVSLEVFKTYKATIQ